ncbi:MAG: TlpA family protein disulfide reductase [Bacteroidales bacterium]|nr:TlpA family protein disulfide reductase [Candidatus Cacconaster equi]
MRKTIAFSALLLLLASCSSNKPVVIKGTIKGYDGKPFLVSLTKDYEMDTLQVKDDSTFYFEKRIDEPWPGFICVQTEGSKSAIFIPGEEYTFDIDMTVKPSEWVYSGRNQDAMDYLDYYKEVFLQRRYEIPETFKEYQAYWESTRDEALEKVKTVKNRQAREYFTDNVIRNSQYFAFNYAFQMRKRGLPLDSDPDFNEYFNSIDLQNEKTCKAMLSSMLNVKADIYSDTIPYPLRYVEAIYELAPNRQVRDSVTSRYLESVFRDCRISSREEADILLAKAAESGVDEATLLKYSERVEKALELAPGCESIDFEVEDPSGRIVKLSDLRGKVVYVDFWATWCLPCCMEIPHMEKLAEKYKGDRRVACISISLDDNVEDWKEKLGEDKPFWPQYRAADGGKAIQKAYCFGSIPRFMLFDKEGKIVTVDAPRPSTGDKIIELIESAL